MKSGSHPSWAATSCRITTMRMRSSTSGRDAKRVHPGSEVDRHRRCRLSLQTRRSKAWPRPTHWSQRPCNVWLVRLPNRRRSVLVEHVHERVVVHAPTTGHGVKAVEHAHAPVDVELEDVGGLHARGEQGIQRFAVGGPIAPAGGLGPSRILGGSRTLPPPQRRLLLSRSG